MDGLARDGSLAKFFYCLKPIVIGRADRTAAGVPKLERAGRDVFVTECSHAVPCRRVRIVFDAAFVFEATPRLFGRAQVVLFSVLLFGSEMRVFGGVAQFHGSVLIFIVLIIVIAG